MKDSKLSFEILLSNYFSQGSNDNQWTAVVFFLYESIPSYDNLDILQLATKFYTWFNCYFLDFHHPSNYFIDAMALRIIWDFFGVKVLSLLDRKEADLIEANEDHIEEISSYTKKVQYSFLRSFLMMANNTCVLEKEIEEWEAMIGKF